MIFNAKTFALLLVTALVVPESCRFASASSSPNDGDAIPTNKEHEVVSAKEPTAESDTRISSAGAGAIRGLKSTKTPKVTNNLSLKTNKAPKSTKGSKSDGTKAPKSTKKDKAPKSTKSPKGTENPPPVKEKGELQADLKKVTAVKDQLQAAFNFNTEDAELCVNASDAHQQCVYDILTPGSDFMCECRPTNGAHIFGEVDANNDDHITLEEILAYFDSLPCAFPFDYTWDGVTNTYNSCTTDFDTFGFSWCSVRTLADGHHAHGFWKYCDASAYDIVWQDALNRLDSNDDGMLSFDEAITNARRRRRRRRRNLLVAPMEGICNDCDIPDDCLNPIVRTIDNECRNYIKSKPFDEEGDEDLLRILASTMTDVYCPIDGHPTDIFSYIDCERRRGGMENWLTRTHLHMYDKPEEVMVEDFGLLACASLILYYNTLMSYEAYFMYQALTFVFPEVDIVEKCQDILVSSRFLDGKDALQWATYTINQGPHEGKTVLAFMGTDFSNIEQVAADIWSTPMASNMVRTMAEEAKEVALAEKPDFIAGHSLGGLLTEMVCSMTGIPGASFAALGAFDPFSRYDKSAMDLIDMDSIPEVAIETSKGIYRDTLRRQGYDEEDIEEVVSTLDVRDLLSRLEYNGLIEDTLHDGVKFEVVMNVHDIPARTFGSIDGNQCSHIASSCDLRWTWFGGGPEFWEYSMGHSSSNYAFNVNSKWTRGNQAENEATIDYSKVFLPGVTKNLVCDPCENDDYCESGSCDVGKKKCFGNGGKYPTFCPDTSSTPKKRTDCYENYECLSGICLPHPDDFWAALGYGLCYDNKLDVGATCEEDSDCKSDYCDWQFKCTSKKSDGASCFNSGDCRSNYCNSFFQCATKKNRGHRCWVHADCKSNSCNWRFRCN